ncbi:actin depolymerizing factor adf [Cystoisospora suis]|uniref:Actin depolymerizing factor adf n=1 Tax=Cystoisospora suis TaxID=483139 RepID=A0A2C6L8X8_9APIC|nr:actin depolymerizing factor adf [Cystoisospora suis]
MASGMGVDDNCVSRFNELKIRKTLKWIVFKIDYNKIVVEKEGKGDAAEFKSSLPKDDCRFGVYDCGNKIQFVLWCPDNAPVKPRMTYASSKDALLKKLDGATAVALEAHEPSDLDSLA